MSISDYEYEISLEGPKCNTALTLPNNPTLAECRKKCDDVGSCNYFSYSNIALCTIYEPCSTSEMTGVLPSGFFFKKSITGNFFY